MLECEISPLQGPYLHKKHRESTAGILECDHCGFEIILLLTQH